MSMSILGTFLVYALSLNGSPNNVAITAIVSEYYEDTEILHYEEGGVRSISIIYKASHDDLQFSFGRRSIYDKQGNKIAYMDHIRLHNVSIYEAVFDEGEIVTSYYPSTIAYLRMRSDLASSEIDVDIRRYEIVLRESGDVLAMIDANEQGLLPSKYAENREGEETGSDPNATNLNDNDS